jgi:hypothetical protein
MSRSRFFPGKDPWATDKTDSPLARGLKVEAIMQHKIQHGEVWYLVKWRELPETANTWEPESSIGSTSEVSDYVKAHADHMSETLSAKRFSVRFLTGLIRGDEVFYSVCYGDGVPQRISSIEARTNHPEELFQFLESTTFKGNKE